VSSVGLANDEGSRLGVLRTATDAAAGFLPDARTIRPIENAIDRATETVLGGRTKRLMDLVVALVALLVSAPLMLLIVVLILATSGRPVLFKQQRIGFGGRPFTCLKFRTMARESEKILKDHLATNPQAATEWMETRKLRCDPRLTGVGRFLRRASLDELPQLINIIAGDMSCVGPRPVVVDELALYGDHVKDYLRARPGLTGLWQVSGRNALGYAQRVKLDWTYVNNWSFRYDILILCLTLLAVLRFEDTA